MYYSGIKPFSTENGPGVRVSLFVSGCRNKCKGCFQPETWGFKYGKKFTDEVEDKIIKYLEPDYITGLTLLGGDPLEPENQKDLLKFLKNIKEKYPNKTIWAFTGYILEDELLTGKNYTEVTDDFLNCIDVLVDGPFIEEKKNLMLPYRGSENQRIILISETLKENKIILSPLMDIQI